MVNIALFIALENLELGKNKKIKKKNYKPKAVETVNGVVDRENWCPGVSFSDSSVSLEDYYLSPYLVVYLVPLVQDLLYVVLQLNARFKKV